jgi:hypothetical protein
VYNERGISVIGAHFLNNGLAARVNARVSPRSVRRLYDGEWAKLAEKIKEAAKEQRAEEQDE